MNITAFWDEHYRIEDDELRVMITEVVTDALINAGWSRKRLAAPKYRHPMTRRKSYLSQFSLLEIFADFIIKAAMIPERSAENPVKNAEAEFYRSKQRKQREISYDAFLEGGGWIDNFGKIYIPKEELAC